MRYICIPVVMCFLLLNIAGCHVNKDILKRTVNNDSLAIVELTRQIEEQKSEITTLTQRIHEMEYLGVTFQPCPQLNIDSLKDALIKSHCRPEDIDRLINQLGQAQTKIRKLQDGSLEITGQVQSLQQTKSKLEETVASYKSVIQNLTTELYNAQTHVRTVTVEKEKKVEKEVLPWYSLWLILIAVIGGGWLGWWLKTKVEVMEEAASDKRARTGK